MSKEKKHSLFNAIFLSLRNIFNIGRIWGGNGVFERDSAQYRKNVAWKNSLRVGTELQFADLPILMLSKKIAKIIAQIPYDFGISNFTAYQIKLEEDVDAQLPDLQLIVADGEGGNCYLAISRKLSVRDIEWLFDAEDVPLLKTPQAMKSLYVRQHTPRMEGWVTMRYRRQMLDIMGKKMVDGRLRNFIYALYVCEDNSKAIEIENYSDGEMEAYVTVYRPAEDIVKVNTPLLKVPAEVKLSFANVTRLDEIPLAELEKTQPEEQNSPTNNANNQALAAADEQLKCDIRIAAKIIDDALRNDLLLADVVRKVLGLSLNPQEKVSFYLPLSAEDCQLLAQRYNVSATDKAAIHERIIQELADFTGEKTHISNNKTILQDEFA